MLFRSIKLGFRHKAFEGKTCPERHLSFSFTSNALCLNPNLMASIPLNASIAPVTVPPTTSPQIPPLPPYVPNQP